MGRRDRPRGLVASALAAVVGCGGETTMQAPDAETGAHDERLFVVPPLQSCEPGAERPEEIRLVSWNTSAGRVSSLAEVRSLLLEQQADVLVLQELDVLVRRTGSVDQPRVLAEALQQEYAFAASLPFDGGEFGMAVLSRLPFADVQRISLPSEGGYEPRIALDATLCAGPVPLRVVDVHLDFVPEVNVTGSTALANELGSVLDAPTIIAGDFNATEDTEGIQALLSTTEAIDVLATWDRGPTRDGERIDYVLASPTLATGVTAAVRVATEASDHLPLRVDVVLP